MDQIILAHDASGPVILCDEGISFWGGVDPNTGMVQDAHHGLHGRCLAGAILLMPTSRGSCSGSSVLLELAMRGLAPAALVFHRPEDILTLGAFIAGRMYEKPIAVLRLAKATYDQLSAQPSATIVGQTLRVGNMSVALTPLQIADLELSEKDAAMARGEEGAAVALAMEAIRTLGAAQGAKSLIDVTRGHIDGCMHASPANLAFAETMERMGARVKIPTSMNAISVDLDRWQDQGVPQLFGSHSSRLARSYVAMGARPTFTCAPYLNEDNRPRHGENIGWSESNAVIFANSVLGARTVKHADFFDLFVAITGRAPLAGVYLSENRQAEVRLQINLPDDHDPAVWPLIGWLAGQSSPDKVPLLEGLAEAEIDEDDLKGLCAAFGTTSAAALLHIAGVTPEGEMPAKPDAEVRTMTRDMMAAAWRQLNSGPERVDLVALGSPHFSLSEIRRFLACLDGRMCSEDVATIITLGRETFASAQAEGLVCKLEELGVRILRDLCWCSISEPVFPPNAKHLVTNSAKYAHYAPGLSGRTVRFAGLADCAKAAVEGHLKQGLPDWLA